MADPMASQDAASEFDAIEAALTESYRGRWFLAEHARRSRARDTGMLLEAIARIERGVSSRLPLIEDRADRRVLAEMMGAFARARREMAEIGASADEAGLDGFGDLVRELETATALVLDASERVQEAAWTLRESGADPGLCDLLDGSATEIYAACGVQTEAASRTGVALRLLRGLEELLAPFAQDERARVDRGPAVARFELLRDDLIFAPVEPMELVEFATADPAEAPARPDGIAGGLFAEIDALGIREKLDLFT
ncbi:MAG: hypothetical protein JO048_07545 [Methylobacteriaceae bacterium]|nr:hypothetical protein [Methylobacteriaceae bacterium]